MSKEELFVLITTKPNGNIEKCNFKKKYQDFYKEINNINFPIDFIWTQKLYHYFNDDLELKLGICPICGKRCKFRSINLGYSLHCSQNCVYKDKHVIEKMKETNINRYGSEFQGNRSEIIEKMKETCQNKYHSDWASSSKEFREKVQKTCLDKFGKKCFFNTNIFKEKSKETCLEKFGEDMYIKTKEFRIISRKAKRGIKGNISKVEKEVIEWLKRNNINFIYQYNSDLYPFLCDFYLPDYDLYIEIQGHWTHGRHPFDENNEKDVEILNLWISKNDDYYNSAINIWTNRDIEKRNIAKQNKLNYLEIFSYKPKETIEILKSELHKYKYKE